MTIERSVLTKIMQLFLGEEVLLPHYVLDYKIDFPFPEHRLAIEADEFDHIGRTSDNEREEEIKEYHECKFIGIKPDGDD